MKQEIKILIGISAITIAILAGAVILIGGSTSPTNQNTKADPNILVRNDSNKLGNPSSKVTLVEFGDYQCPACKAAEPIVKQILAAEKEKINFVFRNLAFLGQESTWAAEAAACAVPEGKFWQYHDYLYENQRAENSGTFSKDNLKIFAKTLGLDASNFSICLDSGKYSQKVASDVADARELGVNSTPTFFLNGKQIIGVPNYNDLKKSIDALLK